MTNHPTNQVTTTKGRDLAALLKRLMFLGFKNENERFVETKTLFDRFVLTAPRKECEVYLGADMA